MHFQCNVKIDHFDGGPNFGCFMNKIALAKRPAQNIWHRKLSLDLC